MKRNWMFVGKIFRWKVRTDFPKGNNIFSVLYNFVPMLKLSFLFFRPFNIQCSQDLSLSIQLSPLLRLASDGPSTNNLHNSSYPLPWRITKHLGCEYSLAVTMGERYLRSHPGSTYQTFVLLHRTDDRKRT